MKIQQEMHHFLDGRYDWFQNPVTKMRTDKVQVSDYSCRYLFTQPKAEEQLTRRYQFCIHFLIIVKSAVANRLGRHQKLLRLKKVGSLPALPTVLVQQLSGFVVC